MSLPGLRTFRSLDTDYLGRRVVRREQSSSIAIELTFAPPQSIKVSINDYIWSKHVNFYLCYGCV